MTTGIYKISCTPSGKYYVGSAVSTAQRWRQHLHHLRRGIHRNPKLQAAWNKYGEHNFEWEVVEVVPSPSNLLVREQEHLDTAFASGTQLNVQPKADSPFGTKRSPETRAKLSRIQQDPERKARFSALRMGHEVSKETRAKISAANTGRKQSPEAEAKRLASRDGYRHSAETIAKMVATQTARTQASARLSEEDVHAIRRRCSGGEPQSAVAHDFAISPSYVSRIVCGNRWKNQ